VSTADKRLDEIADCEFVGKDIAGQIARYATLTQQFAHDVARELATAEEAARAGMRQLAGHPLLAGVDVRWRARRVARVLREARELCQGISAECVAFNVQFRREFAEALRPPKHGEKSTDFRGKVDL
jgi:hypothetical protein